MNFLRQRKQLLSIVLTVLMVICIIPVSISAAPIKKADTNDTEMKAMWISFLEFDAYRSKNTNNSKNFQTYINGVFDKCVDLGMNAVIVQVRPSGDALYKSKYFPWSKHISGQQGKSPGYDPLAYMVKAAHQRNLEIHAWINPYRVSSSNSYADLSSNNQAKKWHNSKSAATRRNVLSYDGKLYYNPASSQVRTLIVNGVKEIINNYDVDGIHMDDYFYPTFSKTNVKTAFDSPEYKSSGSKLSIANWRRKNVNTLVRRINMAVKEKDENLVFGISPAGNIKNLKSDLQYYVDIDTWVKSNLYIDYIMPQVYWGFNDKAAPYDDIVDQWVKINPYGHVKTIIGIATYKAGSSISTEWKSDTNVLKKQIEYARETGKVDGFAFYRYDFYNNKATQKAITQMNKIL